MSMLLPILAAATMASGAASSDLPGLVRADEYPEQALAEGRQVAAAIEIRVDPNGLPIGCRVVSAQGDATLADAVCGIALRKRYAAARLLSGMPAHARVTTMVRLYLPGTPGADAIAAATLRPDYEVHTAGLPATTDVRMVLQTNRKGQVTQCGAKDDAQADLAEAICKARTLFRVEPMLDQRGDAVPYVTETTVRIHAGGR
jgi:hypothetical protein